MVSSDHTCEKTRASRASKSSGRWTKEEHQKFIEGLRIYGKNWKKVEDYVGTRTGAQIRSHAQKFFNRLEKEYHKKTHKGSDTTFEEESEKENIFARKQKTQKVPNAHQEEVTDEVPCEKTTESNTRHQLGRSQSDLPAIGLDRVASKDAEILS